MSGDDRARLLYMVVLGLGLAFVAFGGGRRFGRALRDFGVWGLIFAMVVIAYGFRDTLKRELFPATMVQRAGGEIALRRGMDGHFHAELTVNGRPVRFMIDTGASDVVLSLEDAAAVGIDVARLSFIGRARTANGTVATAPVRLDSISLGDYRDEGLMASVNAGSLGVSLLGMAYLERFARIEISGDEMILHR